MRRGRAIAVILGLSIPVGAPDVAPAAQTIGQIGQNTGGCVENKAYTQRAVVSGPSYSPTIDSVITSWRSWAPQFGGRDVQLIVLRPDSDFGDPSTT